MISTSHLILTFFVSFIATLLLVPLVRRLAIAAQAMDKPNARKVHVKPIPLWGGLGIFGGFGVAITLAFMRFPEIGVYLTPITERNVMGMILASIGIVAVGMVDDRWGMPAKVKLMCQIVLGILMVCFGIKIDSITVPFAGKVFFPTWLTWGITLFWIVGITNALNLLDGLDGLCAGVSVTTATVFLLVSILTGKLLVAYIMAGLTGAALGFLRYNFNPAQIFMGDTGSLFLGLNFAGWTILGLLKGTATFAFAVPVFMLAVPIFDTAAAIVRRLLAGRPIFQADKEHLHHRLLRRGFTQRQVVLIIYCINTVFGLLGLLLIYFYK